MNIARFVESVLNEDVGRGDLYAKISAAKKYKAQIRSNSNGVLAGELFILDLCLQNAIKIEFHKHDGDNIIQGDIIASLEGLDIDVLRCERSMLNMLQHASGIASNARRYFEITTKYNVMLLDTRKTRPLLRELEKYASRLGGAVNHRFGLDDALMIKDTHRKSIENMEVFLVDARKNIPFTTKIELECETLGDALDSFCLDIDILMCDNMLANDIATLVSRKQQLCSNVLIEASGGISLSNIEEYCKTGVDAISVGSLIHQAVWLDFSMKGL